MIKDIIKNNKYCISIEDNLIYIKNYIRIIDISESYIKIKLNNKILKIKGNNMVINRLDECDLSIKGIFNNIEFTLE